MAETSKRSNRSLWVTDEFRKKFGRGAIIPDANCQQIDLEVNHKLQKIKKTIEAIYSKKNLGEDKKQSRGLGKEPKLVKSGTGLPEKGALLPTTSQDKEVNFGYRHELYLPNGLKYPGKEKEREHQNQKNRSKCGSVSKACTKSGLSNTKRSLKLNTKEIQKMAEMISSQPYLNGFSKTNHLQTHQNLVACHGMSSNRGLPSSSVFTKDHFEALSRFKEKTPTNKSKKLITGAQKKPETLVKNNGKKSLKRESLIKSSLLKRQKSGFSKTRGESTSVKAKSCESGKRKSSCNSDGRFKKSKTIRKFKRFESIEVKPARTNSNNLKQNIILEKNICDAIERRKSRSFTQTNKTKDKRRSTSKSKKENQTIELKTINKKKISREKESLSNKTRNQVSLSDKYKNSIVKHLMKSGNFDPSTLKKKLKNSTSSIKLKSERDKASFQTASYGGKAFSIPTDFNPKTKMQMAAFTKEECIDIQESLGCDETKVQIEPSTKITQKSCVHHLTKAGNPEETFCQTAPFEIGINNAMEDQETQGENPSNLPPSNQSTFL